MGLTWPGGRRPSTPEATCAAMIEDVQRRSSRSPRTIRFYHETISILIRELRSCGHSALPWEIEPEDIRKLMRSWESRGLTVATRRTYVSALRTWTRYWRNDAIDQLEIRWPADTRPTVDWLTDEEAQRLVSLDLTPIQALVVHCELCLGMRRVELLRSKVQDWTEFYVDILGKGPQGGKPRRMPYHPDTPGVLARYMSYRAHIVTLATMSEPDVTDPESLLVYAKGGYLLPYSAKGSGIDEMLKPVQAKLGRPFSNHTLRRTFGRLMYRSGVEVATIARMMGHESQDTTLKYIGVNLDDMTAAMTKFKIGSGKNGN